MLWHCWLSGRNGIWPVKNGGWWRWALVSPDGVAPSRMVSVSASVNLSLHHKVQKFSSGTGSPGWSRKKGRKMVVVLWCFGEFWVVFLENLGQTICISVPPLEILGSCSPLFPPRFMPVILTRPSSLAEVSFCTRNSFSTKLRDWFGRTSLKWSMLGTCEASRFNSISNRTSDSGFDS